MVKNKKTKILILLLIGVFLITSGLGCKWTTNKRITERIKPVNLVYWRTQDSQDAFKSIIDGWQALYPHISITYKTIREEEYEQTLLEAWAEDRGPDLFSIPNTWLGKYQTKILPVDLSQEIVLARQIMVGMLKKEPKIIEERKKVPSLRDLREIFVETVSDGVILKDKIYGLPLSLDLLVLYYNKDLLNNAGIIAPPQTWQEFVNDVNALTLQDRYGNFIQSGTAMGTAENVANLTDILSLLMLQNGTSMVGQENKAIFDQALINDSSYFPGIEALRFYTGFANPYQEIYTWNEKERSSLDAFIQGRVGFILGYSNYLPIIKSQAPKLNFDIAKVPQIRSSFKEVNYAQYWLETVSKKTKYPSESWGFLLYAIENQNAQTFVEKTKRPTAHRVLIQKQLEDFDLAPFAKGVLTAQTWYSGKNYSLVEEAFKEMVKNTLTGEKTLAEAIKYCAQKVNLTY